MSTFTEVPPMNTSAPSRLDSVLKSASARSYLIGLGLVLAVVLCYTMFLHPSGISLSAKADDGAAEVALGTRELGWSAFMFPNMCGMDAAVCRAEATYWENLANRRHSSSGHLQPPGLTDQTQMFLFALVPTYQCPVEMRLGVWGDGGKWTCLLPRAIQPKPVVYSIGSFQHFSFEFAAWKHLKTRPFTFDPFLPAPAQERMRALPFLEYHSVGLAGSEAVQKYRKQHPNWTFLTFPDLMARLNHTYVDVLKMDCEGCEVEVVKDWERMYGGGGTETAAAAAAAGAAAGAGAGRPNQLTLHGGELPFGQLLIEVHNTKQPAKTLPLFYSLENLGYRLFHVEPNPACSVCAELAFIHETLVMPSSQLDCRPFLASSLNGGALSSLPVAVANYQQYQAAKSQIENMLV